MYGVSCPDPSLTPPVPRPPQTIAVGYTPFSAGRPPPSYYSLLRAALLSVEERPTAELSWAVVTNARAAARLRLQHPGGLAVVNWNGTTVSEGGGGRRQGASAGNLSVLR